MKRFFALFLLLALCVGLTACDRWVKNDYSVITPHVEQPPSESAPSQQEQPPTVSNRTELRGAVLSFIRNWTEQGSIFVRAYQGNISEDLQETILYATQEDPIGAYAVDYMDAEYNGTDRIGVNIVFRRSAAEVDAIVTVSGNSSACAKIQQALEAFDISLTLRIRNYQEMDFAQYIRSYSLQHPETVAALPEVSAEVYPKEGETRILELHFSYSVSRDEMRLMQSSVDTILSSASSYIRSGKDDLQKARLLYRFLTARFTYSLSEEVPTTPAYSLLCLGKAHSLSFASVFYAECIAANLDCLIVTGSKDGEAYYWNLLRVEGEYYHVDLMRSLTREESELRLLYSPELSQEDYVWDASLYPTTAVMEVTVPEPPDEPVEPSIQPSEENSAAPTEESTEAPSEAESDSQESSAESSSDNP